MNNNEGPPGYDLDPADPFFDSKTPTSSIGPASGTNVIQLIQKAQQAAKVAIAVQPELTDAQQNLARLKAAIAQMPKEFQEQVQYVSERIQFLNVRYGEAASYAVLIAGLSLSVEQRQ